VFAYRVTDILTDDDVRQGTDAFDAVLEDNDTVHLYAEVEGLRGADARAIWLDLVYGLRHLRTLRHIGRVALVTDAAWIARLARIEARLLPLGEIRTCRPSARADAREWVRSAPTIAETPSALDDLNSWFDAGGLDAGWSNTSWFDGYVPRGATRPDNARPRATARFGHTVHRTHVLLHDVAGRLEVEGTAPAYRALRAVLPALRDRLPAPEAADLAAQLTTLVRGVFYQGYRPGRTPETGGEEEFLAAVSAGLGHSAPFSARAATAAVGGALEDAVSAGEWAQVLHALPKDVRSLLQVEVPA
jgi:uncharacterized protein (DUF2267 family)